MYRCELCRRVVPPRTSEERVIIEVRDTRHPTRSSSQAPNKRGGRTNRKRWRDDPGGAGPQIAREVRACPDCARAHAQSFEPMRRSEPAPDALAPAPDAQAPAPDASPAEVESAAPAGEPAPEAQAEQAG